MKKNRVHDTFQHSIADRLKTKHGEEYVEEGLIYDRGEIDIAVYTPRSMRDYELPCRYYEIKCTDTCGAYARAMDQKERFFEYFDFLRDMGETLHFIYIPKKGGKIRHWTKLARTKKHL